MVAVLAVLLVVQQRGDEAATDVFVIGDSIEVMAGGKDLGKEGWTVDAVSGRTTAQGIEVAEAHDLSDVPVVMVALGTNDYRADAESYGRLVDRMLEAIGPGPMVIWINIDTNTPALAGAKTGVNAALTAAAARHPNLRVADWDTYIRDVPDEGGLRAGDGIHYGLKGSQVRRDWMRGLVGPMG
ncbi:MAG: putative O-acetyltransferase [Acidimicrobiales bacterium]|nr:putative O-acetyltransferase [Acidimicrobiales bacterium]